MAKTHLEHIFSKTGLRDQADLMRATVPMSLRIWIPPTNTSFQVQSRPVSTRNQRQFFKVQLPAVGTPAAFAIRDQTRHPMNRA
jgi:hypothetical protein